MSARCPALVLALLVVAVPVGALPSGVPSLHVDAAHSVAAFSIKHLVVTTVRGTMRLVSVNMPMQGSSPIPASVDAVIDVASIDTSEADRDRDLRSPDWFDVGHFPTMHFHSTRIVPAAGAKTFQVIGTLELHGVTRPVTLDVTIDGNVIDGDGKHHYGYAASGTLDRRDFGLDAVKKTPGGDLLVGTDVVVTIDLDMVDA